MTYKIIFMIVNEVLKMIEHKHKTNKNSLIVRLITLLVFASTFRKREIKSLIKESKESYSNMFPYVPQLSAIVKK